MKRMRAESRPHRGRGSSQRSVARGRGCAKRSRQHYLCGSLEKHRNILNNDHTRSHFIADFYCCRAKLIIEIDGRQHETEKGMQKDELRTEKLEAYGIQVIRIPNRCIDKEFFMVCDYIDQTVKSIIGDA